MLGDNIKELRKKNKILAKELANHLHISTGTMSDYEKNRSKPGYEILVKISDYFDVSLDWLITGKERISSTNENLDPAMEKYSKLNERNKIKAEVYIDMIYDEQVKEKAKLMNGTERKSSTLIDTG